MAHKHAFDAALEQMNRGNAAGPVLERIGDTDRMRCTVVGAEGCSEFFFDASDYLDLASRTYARDIPALVAHMLQYAKSFIAAPQGDAQSKLAAATRLATEEGPPPPSPPLAPVGPFAPAWLVVRTMSFDVRRPPKRRKLRNRGWLIPRRRRCGPSRNSIGWWPACKRSKQSGTARDRPDCDAWRSVMRREKPTGAHAARWSVLSALLQRTADGHGESMAGKKIGGSESSRSSCLRCRSRRQIDFRRSTAEILPLAAFVHL